MNMDEPDTFHVHEKLKLAIGHFHMDSGASVCLMKSRFPARLSEIFEPILTMLARHNVHKYMKFAPDYVDVTVAVNTHYYTGEMVNAWTSDDSANSKARTLRQSSRMSAHQNRDRRLRLMEIVFIFNGRLHGPAHECERTPFHDDEAEVHHKHGQST